MQTPLALYDEKKLFRFSVEPPVETNGRFYVTDALKYVAKVSSLSFTSKLNGLSWVRGGGCSTSASTPKTVAEPFSELWSKEPKLDILEKGCPAIFEDMSKLKEKKRKEKRIKEKRRKEKRRKEKGYFATTNFRKKPLSFYSLKNKAGVYMITNKKTPKIYIGMSKDLKGRFYNYLDVKRLEGNFSIRIHKALLKYGFNHFSISILEFAGCRPTVKELKEREDFYIKVFRPQYNIKRSQYNSDLELSHNFAIKTARWLPTKMKSLLDKCLDPSTAALEWHLMDFRFNKRRGFYFIKAITPKKIISANSLGWFEGNITNESGFTVLGKTDKKIFSPSVQTHGLGPGSTFAVDNYHFFKLAYKLIDHDKLADFFYRSQYRSR